MKYLILKVFFIQLSRNTERKNITGIPLYFEGKSKPHKHTMCLLSKFTLFTRPLSALPYTLLISLRFQDFYFKLSSRKIFSTIFIIKIYPQFSPFDLKLLSGEQYDSTGKIIDLSRALYKWRETGLFFQWLH